MSAPIRVLIIDDSAVVRQVLSEIIASDPALTVSGTAPDPVVAREKIRRDRPDVITLDVEMPRMDGITFLRELMASDPIPVVMCSSLTEKGAEISMRALQYGAIDIINKPRQGTRQFIEEMRVQICDAIKAAAAAQLLEPLGSSALAEETDTNADNLAGPSFAQESLRTTEKVVVVGASTGGTEALRVFLEALPCDAPGIVIVQHMPREFTSAYVARLDKLCRVTVKEAVDGDTVIPGRALIAPGNQHMLLKRSGTHYYVQIKDGPLVSRHRPSVNVLFRSAARYVGVNAIGIIMTGMGDDGARGMLEMKEAKAFNLAQDQASCVVFGLPQEAIKLGAVDKVVPLAQLASEVMSRYKP